MFSGSACAGAGMAGAAVAAGGVAVGGAIAPSSCAAADVAVSAMTAAITHIRALLEIQLIALAAIALLFLIGTSARS